MRSFNKLVDHVHGWNVLSDDAQKREQQPMLPAATREIVKNVNDSLDSESEDLTESRKKKCS